MLNSQLGDSRFYNMLIKNKFKELLYSYIASHSGRDSPPRVDIGLRIKFFLLAHNIILSDPSNMRMAVKERGFTYSEDDESVDFSTKAKEAHLQRHKKLWMENPRNEEASVLIDGIYVYCSPGRVQTKDLTLRKYARAAIKARKESASSNRQLESTRCKPFEAWLTGTCLEALCRHKKYYKLSLFPSFKKRVGLISSPNPEQLQSMIQELKGLVKESTDRDDREHAFRLYLMEKNYIKTTISGVSLVLVEDLPKVATAGRTSRLEK